LVSMTLSKNSTVKLNTGADFPVIGFGTYQIPDESAKQAVLDAIALGYPLIDTAEVYRNETGVGAAIKESGVARDKLFVTTKLWISHTTEEDSYQAGLESLRRLGLDYVDLYIIHAPSIMGLENESPKHSEARKARWAALERLHNEGKAKAIGVSNYEVKHLEEMKSYAKVQPALNQVELHINLQRRELVAYCHKNNIVLQGYSTLGQGKGDLLKKDTVLELASKYNKSPAQILLRWSLELQVPVIPKSTHKHRMEENLNLFDFSLTGEEVQKLNHLDDNKVLTWTPYSVS